jgi:hypothetical protein
VQVPASDWYKTQRTKYTYKELLSKQPVGELPRNVLVENVLHISKETVGVWKPQRRDVKSKRGDKEAQTVTASAVVGD